MFASLLFECTLLSYEKILCNQRTVKKNEKKNEKSAIFGSTTKIIAISSRSINHKWCMLSFISVLLCFLMIIQPNVIV